MSGSRQLVELDISWNRMRPKNTIEFLDALAENRTLQVLNISWNHLLGSIDYAFKNPIRTEIDRTEFMNNGNA